MRVYHNIKSIYNKKSKILILGSMPSKTSRDNKFYYANQNNRFWKIISILFEKEFEDHVDKEKFLLKNGIAMWDTIKSCDIEGSSDASIKNIEVNDINKILSNSKINRIFCTGLKSYKTFNKYFKVDIPVECLPSPSGANASKSLDDLTNEYKIIKEVIEN